MFSGAHPGPPLGHSSGGASRERAAAWGDAGAAAMSADGMQLERAGVPGGPSETVRGTDRPQGGSQRSPVGREEGRLSQTVLVVGEVTCRYRHLGVVGNLGEGSLGV